MEKVFVHKYKWSHDKKRKKFKKLKKEGKVEIISKNREGWLYRYK